MNSTDVKPAEQRAQNPADDAPHLLVVDDDRRIRALLSRFLLGEGYRVSTAETAGDARAKLAGLKFDLLILDVMMPGESGFDFARSIRISSTVPILMLTARDEKESRIMGLEIGADDYLAKPFEPRELSLRVANILKRAQPPRVQTTSAGETVPRQALAGNGEAVSERTVDVQVNRLRRKIERDPGNPLIVQTVRGVGYRLVAASSAVP